MKKYTLWTLNDGNSLLTGTLFAKLGLLFNLGPCRIKLGKRREYGNNLMPDVEYSVPIVPKCIGSYFDSPYRPAILDKIREYYENEAGQKHFKLFWDQALSGSCMKTENYRGYYSLLEDTGPNILVGYSLGGLVARYLYWLDKEVFKKNIIHGVVSISTPLFGSPLANPQNTRSIVEGLWEMFMILIGKEEALMSLEILKHVELEQIRDFLKQMIQRLKHNLFTTKLSVVEKGKKNIFQSFFEILYNWTGGLRNDPDTAFYDLNIMRMEPNLSTSSSKYSVLGSINNALDGNEKNYFGIISASFNLANTIFEGIVFLLGSVLEDWIKENPGSHLSKMVNQRGGFSDIDARKSMVKERLEKIEEIYKTKVMKENPGVEVSNSLISRVLKWHSGGLPAEGLDPEGHDFLIPSAYQLSLKKDQNVVLHKNFVNMEANHITGGKLMFDAGRENRKVCLNFIKELL